MRGGRPETGCSLAFSLFVSSLTPPASLLLFVSSLQPTASSLQPPFSALHHKHTQQHSNPPAPASTSFPEHAQKIEQEDEKDDEHENSSGLWSAPTERSDDGALDRVRAGRAAVSEKEPKRGRRFALPPHSIKLRPAFSRDRMLVVGAWMFSALH